MKPSSHYLTRLIGTDVFRCAACDEEFSGTTVRLRGVGFEECRGRKLGDVNFFVYRRPTVRELLERRT